jgi:hypothetical protein
MSKLHIFGCSHCYPSCGSNNFWGTLLAEKLNLTLCYKVGIVSRGANSILLDLQKRILLGEINRGDVAIWNTSYCLRTDIVELNGEIHGEQYPVKYIPKRFWKPTNLLFNKWYLQTAMGYELLKLKGIETYQWVLDPLKTLQNMQHRFGSSNINGSYTTDSISKLETTIPAEQKYINKWENLIQLPLSEHKEIDCWSKWIEAHSLNPDDLHLDKSGHLKFTNIFYDQIVKYREKNNDKKFR